MAAPILNLGTTWRWVVYCTVWPLHQQYRLNRSLGGPHSWSGRTADNNNCSCSSQAPDRPAADWTILYQLYDTVPTGRYCTNCTILYQLYDTVPTGRYCTNWTILYQLYDTVPTTLPELHSIFVSAWNIYISEVESSWNVMAHGDAREGKWRGNWRMEWVGSTLHTTSEHGVSSITTADVHTSAAISRLNWRPADLNGLVRFAERRNLVSARVPSHFKRSLHKIAKNRTGKYLRPSPHQWVTRTVS